MTRNETRWSQIVFWDHADIVELHRREKVLEARCDGLIAARKPPIEVWDLAFIESMQTKHDLDPYWDIHLQVGIRNARMNQFLRGLYPLWKPICGEVDFKDMTDLHRADMAIYRNGMKPNRGTVSSSQQSVVRSSRDGAD